MNLAIKTGTETMTAWEIIPRLKRYQMLPQLIKEAIIDRAIAEIECTPEQTAQAKEVFYQHNHLVSEAERQAWLAARGMTIEDVAEIATRNLKIEKFKQERWGGALTSYFLQRKGQLDKVSFSIIRVNNMGLAQELYFRIQEQEDTFQELAKTYSQGQEAAVGGLIPGVEIGSLPPAFTKIFAGKQPGTLLAPFPLGKEFVIIRIEHHTSVQLDKAISQRLLNEQFQHWLNQEVKQHGYCVENLLAA